MHDPEPTVAPLPGGVTDGINYIGAGKVILVLYAPFKKFVHVIGEFNDWHPAPASLMHRTPDGERYWLELRHLPTGQEVAFQYLVDGTIAVADPYTDKILDPDHDPDIPRTTYPDLKPYPTGATGIVSILQTDQPPYPWRVPRFQRPDPTHLVIYELLVRDFVADRTYNSLAATLPYLQRLGVNAIELMPIQEFSGNDSWGYNPTFYFAPDKAYGTKHDLKAFIDTCHEHGIAVILDLVLNHAEYEFPYVKLYWDGSRPAANNPFFNQQSPHPYSVFFDFNHESPATRQLVERVVRYWLQEYKVDGYRFDLSKGFTQTYSGHDLHAWSLYDASRVAILKHIYDTIRRADPTAYVILEHFADQQEERELADYGLLLWGNLNHAYRNLAKGVDANPGLISYRERQCQRPAIVGYMESHDEERLLYDVVQHGRSRGAYNTRDLATALERAKLAAAFFFPVPGPKLIWQFGELGYDVSIYYHGRTGAKPILWEYADDPQRQKLYQVYAALIRLKLTYPAFHTTHFTLRFAQTEVVKRFALYHPTMDVFIIGNCDVDRQIVAAEFPHPGAWYDFFSGQEVHIANIAEALILEPGEFHLLTTEPLPMPQAGLVPWKGVVLSRA